MHKSATGAVSFAYSNNPAYDVPKKTVYKPECYNM